MTLRSITFEHIPSDYAILKIVEAPEDAGGDTPWASGYEVYDKLSPEFQRLAERLTATHYQPSFVKVKEEFGEVLIADYRGSPENKGLDFKAEQLVKTPSFPLLSKFSLDVGSVRSLTCFCSQSGGAHEPSHRLEELVRHGASSRAWMDQRCYREGERDTEGLL